MKIAVVGLGYVGNAVRELLTGHHELVCYDIEHGDFPEQEVNRCQALFICVPTPTGAEGALDTSAVSDVMARTTTPQVIVKSTVSPGTIDRLAQAAHREVTYWPEFIGQSRYHNPQFPSRIIDVPWVVLGGTSSATRWTAHLLQPILGPTKVYYRCSALDAELVKLVENAYFSTKVTFVNEMKSICDALGADWDMVREGWLLDPRVERMHTLVFDDEPGFAGACLPKDLAGLLAASQQGGYQASLLREVLTANVRFRDRA